MSERQPQIIDIEQVILAKGGEKAKRIPKFIIRWFKKFVHQDFINGFLKEGYVGIEFCQKAIEYLGIEYEVEGMENIPNDGRKYTFASNHPLGAIDGVTLGVVLSTVYGGNIKFLMNDILMNIKGMAPMGIPINKLGSQAKNLPLLINEIYESDNQILIFPAGLCSRKIDGKIQDVEWGKSFVKKSRQTDRDIIPIYFDGENSKRFYRISTWQKRLGLKFNFAMMLLPDEMYRSRGKKYKIRIGKPIPISSLDKSKSDFEWAQEIRRQVYEL